MASKRGTEDINLTAMIDLFSTLIIFLLMTAVWNQIDSLSTNVDNVTASDSPQPQTEPEKKKAMLSITILTDRIEMTEDESITQFPLLKGAAIDFDRMKGLLTSWRSKYPDRKDIILHTHNEAPYQHLIQIFDFMVGQGWPDVGVNTQ